MKIEQTLFKFMMHVRIYRKNSKYLIRVEESLPNQFDSTVKCRWFTNYIGFVDVFELCGSIWKCNIH